MYPSCPRCESSNTKFCYYNNYSLSQPRYYCRDCRRYWTIGGSLRDIPPGEGSRRRSSQRRRQRSCSSTKRLGKKENDHHHHDRDNSCPEIDLAAVFANFLNGRSSNSSSTDDTSTRSGQGTKKIEDEEGLGQFLEEDMFEFQDFLNDKDIQEIMISCSFSDL